MKFYYLKYNESLYYGSRFRRHGFMYRNELEKAIGCLSGTPIIHQHPKKLFEIKAKWDKLGIKFEMYSCTL